TEADGEGSIETTAGFSPASRPMPPPDWLDAPRRATGKARPSPLTGTQAAVLEENSLTLPVPLRQQLGDLRDAAGCRQVYVLPGTDGCLWLTTAAGLARLNEQLEQAGRTAVRVRQARRICFAQTEACAVDGDGRLQLPEHLLRSAGLQREVVLVGVGDK